MKKADWLAFLSEDPGEARRTTVAEHLEKCPKCREEAEEIRRVLRGADAVREEIRKALGTVDWNSLPDRITDYVYNRAAQTEPASRREGVRAGLFRPWLRPVLVSLVLGLVLGSAGMYLVLRNAATVRGRGAAFSASREFLDRVELEIARRETVDYLQRSQYVLLDFFGEPGGGPPAGTAAASAAEARELLAKKKYLNPQLEKYQMAKAKAICDQIEVLFLELAQIRDELPAAELAQIRSMVRDRRLLLKINIVKEELQNGV